MKPRLLFLWALLPAGAILLRAAEAPFDFEVLQFRIGRTNEEPSYISMRIAGPDEGRRGYPESWTDMPGYPRLLTLPLQAGRDRLGAVAFSDREGIVAIVTASQAFAADAPGENPLWIRLAGRQAT